MILKKILQIELRSIICWLWVTRRKTILRRPDLGELFKERYSCLSWRNELFCCGRGYRTAYMARTSGQLPVAEESPWLTASKKIGTSIIKPQRQLCELGRGTWASELRPHPQMTTCLSSYEAWAEDPAHSCLSVWPTENVVLATEFVVIYCTDRKLTLELTP